MFCNSTSIFDWLVSLRISIIPTQITTVLVCLPSRCTPKQWNREIEHRCFVIFNNSIEFTHTDAFCYTIGTYIKVFHEFGERYTVTLLFAVVQRLSLLHNFIQQSLNSDSAQVQTLPVTCRRYAMVQWSRLEIKHKRFLSVNNSAKTIHHHHHYHDLLAEPMGSFL